MSRHERFIQRALAIAMTSEHGKWHLGAVVTRGSAILAYSPNKFRNPPWISHRGATFHAEVEALRLTRNPRGCTVYIARADHLGNPRMARPCDNCWKELTRAGVATIVYTNEHQGLTMEKPSSKLYSTT